MADKYALATTKNLGLVRNYRPCSAGNFLIMHPSFVVKTYHYQCDIYVETDHQNLRLTNGHFTTISDNFLPTMLIMVIQVVEFSNGGYKIRKVFEMKILYIVESFFGA